MISQNWKRNGNSSELFTAFSPEYCERLLAFEQRKHAKRENRKRDWKAGRSQTGSGRSSGKSSKKLAHKYRKFRIVDTARRRHRAVFQLHRPSKGEPELDVDAMGERLTLRLTTMGRDVSQRAPATQETTKVKRGIQYWKFARLDGGNERCYRKYNV